MKTLSERTEPVPRSLRIRAFLAQHTLFSIGAVLFGSIVVIVLLAPLISPYSPLGIDMGSRFLPPSAAHPMGTDKFGRDVLSRVLAGGKLSLSVGVIVTSLAICIGVPIGIVSGYIGGRTDMILMRVTDIFLAFPPLLLPITIVAVLGPGFWNAMLALSISWFPWYARIMRGAVLRLRSENYIQAAKVISGASHLTIMRRHVLPNAMTPVIVQGSSDFGFTILAAASLSFIGLGARAPDIEWGLMAADARLQLLDAWWIGIFPGLAIFVTVLSVNLVGDGLRDILDPKQRRRA